ncbi:MAG: hypothetical protein H0V23_11235 [Nocardioidaceae bacterium]|nr:hypothetical protein [Nocardioidaceae bacterium]
MTTLTQSLVVATSRDRRLLQPGWPLLALFLPFPLWWLLGISHFVFILLAIPMAMELLRRRPVFTPHGFGWWLTFLVWAAAGIFVLWAEAPGTVQGGSLARMIPFAYRGLWFLAITVVLLYVMNLSEQEMPSRRIYRLLAYMFLVTLVGGFAGILLPTLQFPSALELVANFPKTGFVYALIHPTLSEPSDFLGYVQSRPTAPFAYANAWGNNFGMFLPFFLLAWLGKDAGWRRRIAPLVLALALVPIAYSLNRGLWLGLGLGGLIFLVRLATLGKLKTVMAAAGALGVVGGMFAVSPLYDTVTLRIETPHSDERRSTVAEDVLELTWKSSPVLGFGSNREIQGSYASIAGGETPDCKQCAAPPLGTQGFLWRLIFTTGLVGAALYLSFIAVQLKRHLGSPDPVSVMGCLCIILSLIFFFVYDSLESPLFTLMIAIGLMNRRMLDGQQPLVEDRA